MQKEEAILRKQGENKLIKNENESIREENERLKAKIKALELYCSQIQRKLDIMNEESSE